MNRVAFLALALLAAGVLRVAAADELTVYIAPRFITPVTWGAWGCVLLLLLAVPALRRGVWRVDGSLLLLVPAALLVITPQVDHSLLTAVRFRSLAPPRIAGGMVDAPLDADGYRCLTVQQVYAELDALDDTGIAAHTYRISTEATLTLAPDGGGDDAIDLQSTDLVMVRMLMVCCIADLQPIGIVVANRSGADDSAYDEWFHIRGTLTFRRLPQNAGWYAYITDDEVTPIGIPDRPYLYPDYAALAAQVQAGGGNR